MTDPVNEADLAEQRADVLPEDGEPEADGLDEVEEVGEADPVDVRDQRVAVPPDDDRPARPD